VVRWFETALAVAIIAMGVASIGIRTDIAFRGHSHRSWPARNRPRTRRRTASRPNWSPSPSSNQARSSPNWRRAGGYFTAFC